MGFKLLRRLAMVVPLMIGVTFIVFAVTRLLPGDPSYLIGGAYATDADRAQIRASLGLDRPIPEQYLTFLARLAHGDWGKSTTTSKPVLEDLHQYVPATVELGTASLLVALTIGIALGCLAGLKPGGLFDRLALFVSAIAISLPSFWLALIAIAVLYLQLHWIPAPSGQIDASLPYPPQRTGLLLIDSVLAGDVDAFTSTLQHLVTPALTLALVLSGPIIRQTRAAVVDARSSAYVEYAQLSGLSRLVSLRYVVRNSLLPIITIVGVMYAITLGGAVLVETVFGWGGLGTYAVQAIGSLDYFAIQGVVLVTGVFSVLVYLAVDILHSIADPRIRT